MKCRQPTLRISPKTGAGFSLSAPFGRGEGRGEVKALCHNSSTLFHTHPSPSIPLPVKGRGKLLLSPLDNSLAHVRLQPQLA